MATSGFGERLAASIETTTPLCVGIDPSASLLSSWGLADDATGLEVMGRRVVEAVVSTAAAVKPQVAFFERHGAAGYVALERIVTDAREAGLVVIADAKRGDIDSTMSAYADAWLGPGSPLEVDAVTTTAYLGIGAMGTLVELARSGAKGIFVVVASSNPEGRTLQRAQTETGRRVEEELLAELAGLNDAELAETKAATGSFGAVVGATRTAGELDLASLHGPFLVPGVGAQGATPDDVAAIFAGCRPGTVLVNASRSVLGSGPTHEGLRSAARQLGDELAVALGATS
jgi:orotidine-5'-phosphate decarboxylase